MGYVIVKERCYLFRRHVIDLLFTESDSGRFFRFEIGFLLDAKQLSYRCSQRWENFSFYICTYVSKRSSFMCKIKLSLSHCFFFQREWDCFEGWEWMWVRRNIILVSWCAFVCSTSSFVEDKSENVICFLHTLCYLLIPLYMKFVWWTWFLVSVI